MNAVGERNAGKPLVAFDEGALCNDRVLLYSAIFSNYYVQLNHIAIIYHEVLIYYSTFIFMS